MVMEVKTIMCLLGGGRSFILNKATNHVDDVFDEKSKASGPMIKKQVTFSPILESVGFSQLSDTNA